MLKDYSTKENSSQALKQAWGDFVDQVGMRKGGWDWYATLTYKPRTATYKDFTERSGLLYQGRTCRVLDKPGWDKPGWKYTERACDTFLETVGAVTGLYDSVHYFRARETQQWRGVPHWHLFVGGVKDLRRMDFVDWHYGKYGIARIEPYKAELGARYYLCKYVTKELGDVQFSPNLKGLT